MKKSFIYFILALYITPFIIVMASCEGTKYDPNDNIYAEKHKIYSAKDTLYTGITTYYTKIKGHDVVYHIYSGKNKSQMEVWHFENECNKCKKTTSK